MIDTSPGRSGSCPNCGAPVRLRYSNAVQTTCEYCRSILVRRDVDLEKVGVVADLPVDASPVQLGTEGVAGNKPFVVVGRIIYEYDAGTWNEWHLLFNDGSSGWLADAQLEYAVSRLVERPPELPAPAQIRRGLQLQWDGLIYQVTTITEANYRGVEGDLPFEYWDKERVRFVDLRSADARFATIDYSEIPPLLFLGRSYSFDELKLKNVRQFEGWS